MVNHLGSQVSALADGQLSPSATERALAHVAGCTECAAELRAARAAHRALAAAMDVPATPDLTARLLAIGTSPVAARPRSQDAALDGSAPLPGGPRRDRVPADCLRGDLDRRRTVPTRALVLVGAGLGVAVAALVSLGDDALVVPGGHPAEAMSMLGQVPAVAPVVQVVGSERPPALELDREDADDQVLAWMAQEGWSCPVELPEDLELTAVRLHDDGVLELDLVGADGTMVVTERRGRLHPAAVSDARVAEIGGRQVHVLSTAPWHGVWQSGGTVVDVIAQTPPETVSELVAAYPDHPYDDGIPARIARGWSTLAGAWNP